MVVLGSLRTPDWYHVQGMDAFKDAPGTWLLTPYIVWLLCLEIEL